MAKKRNTDFFSSLRTQGIRKRVARALSDLESGSQQTRDNAEKLARRAITDLRSAADTLEKRLNIGTRSSGAKKAAKSRARKTTGARKTTARKSTARKTTARKTTARKTTARKSTPRKTSARKTTARKSTPRKRATKSS